MSNVKTREFWKNPRGTIACVYKDNDICYATSGMYSSSFIIRECLRFYQRQNKDFHVENMWEEKTMLEVGCGTGRIARLISYFFKSVYGYDPVPECIEIAKLECQPMKFDNLTYGTTIPENGIWDASCCISVIEHLNEADTLDVLRLLKKHTKPGGPITIVFHTKWNGSAMKQMFGPGAYKEWETWKPCLVEKVFTND